MTHEYAVNVLIASSIFYLDSALGKSDNWDHLPLHTDHEGQVISRERVAAPNQLERDKPRLCKKVFGLEVQALVLRMLAQVLDDRIIGFAKT